MKDKLIIILGAIIFAIGYYYSSIYIPSYSFSFDLIDIDKYPDLWKWSPSILTLVASLLILILACICVNFAERIYHIPSPSQQTTRINKYSLFFLSVSGGVLFVALQYLISSSFFNQTINSEVNNFEMWYLPALLATCCTYPIAEEIFFRKGILNLLHSKLNLIVSISLSSILFAAIHFPNYRQMITTYIGGFLLGILYKNTNSLFYPIVFHISWNTTVVILNFTAIF